MRAFASAEAFPFTRALFDFGQIRAFPLARGLRTLPFGALCRRARAAPRHPLAPQREKSSEEEFSSLSNKNSRSSGGRELLKGAH